MTKALNLTGSIFGRLTVIERFPKSTKAGKTRWVCLCTCGEHKVVVGSCLVNCHTTSCGCNALQSRTKHGCHDTVEYMAWSRIKQRCYNHKHISFHNYGGRGIVVCKRWLYSFENFLSDMGKKPSNSHSIDRENNNGNYEPGNCR